MRSKYTMELIDKELERLDIKITEERSFDYSFIYNRALSIYDYDDVLIEEAVKRAVVSYITEVIHANI